MDLWFRVRSVLVCAALASATLVLVPAAASAAPAMCGVAAHRGDHSVYTENSLGAMRAAVADAVDYLELDVRSSSDNMLYLMHDPLVDRTTDGTGAISLKTQDQISALHLDDGERVPTLAQVLTMAKPSRVDVLLELKAMGDGSSFRRLVYQVQSFGADRVRIVSGSRRLLDKVSTLAPGISQGIISRVQLTPAEVAPYDGVLLLVGAVTDAWLSSMPYPVWVWPSDSVTDWDWMANRVRGVITNHPVAFEQNRPVACPT